MVMERSWHDSRASKCTAGPVWGPGQGDGMLCFITEKIQHAFLQTQGSLALLRWEGDRAVRPGSQMRAQTQTATVRACLQNSWFRLTLKTTIHKTQIPMRSLGAELEEELMMNGVWGLLSNATCVKALPLKRRRRGRMGVIVIVLLVEVLGTEMAIMPPAHIPDSPPGKEADGIFV